MLTVRLIPCLDTRDGRVVKGVQFQNLRDAGDPVELAAYYEREGADELVLLDVTATGEGRAAALEMIADLRKVLRIPLVVGGGVRSLADATALLEAGADRVSVNSAAVERPRLIYEIAQRFGVQCVVVAIDARRAGDEYEVLTHSGTQRQLLRAEAWARTAQELGAGELLLTSWDRDGTRAGYDLELIERIANAVTIPVVASGGAASAQDFSAALGAGASAVLAASIFHDRETTVRAAKEQLNQAGFRVRT